ncbi:MAG: DNA polymerase III subunit delta [Syntrophobacterales bacterium GWC2_56_13]|nr:MAG: DNA polymerase III subunit delta [Syntrophobacterales bacterium GWC2_56_13]
MDLHDDDTGRGVSLDTVLAELKRGKTFPCYLLCGDEEFRLRNALEKITQRLIPDAQDRELNLFVTDGEHEDVDSLCESLITPPLLPGRKVVVVRDTRLFQSKKVLMPLIGRIRERLDQDPGRAAADFMQFLGITGLQFDDLRDGGWRKIDDETWKRIVPDDDGQGRETWLPKAVEICVSSGAAQAKERPEETDRLERILTGGMPEGNHLLLTAETVDRRKKLFKTVSAAGRVLSFSKVKGEARQQQAVQEMAAEILAKRGKRLSSGAWSALGQKTGFSIRESLSAIEKLITYAGEKSQIEAADVEAVVGRTREDTVFELNGALVGRNLTLALRTLHELLDQGLHPLMIMTMITKEIRFLFQAKLLIASGRLGSFSPELDYGRFQKAVYPAVRKLAGDGEDSIALASQHPFVVYQALKNAGRFTRAELAGYLELLVRTDLALKTTGKDPRLLLERFLLAVCGSR